MALSKSSLGLNVLNVCITVMHGLSQQFVLASFRHKKTSKIF